MVFNANSVYSCSEKGCPTCTEKTYAIKSKGVVGDSGLLLIECDKRKQHMYSCYLLPSG